MMTRLEIKARTRDEMIGEYPIEGRLPDWYFNITETSNDAWRVEGCDIWGRKVAKTGSDPDELLSACTDGAATIVGQRTD